MKDWRRSPEPPGMMGVQSATYEIQGNWGQPDELSSDPASPLPHTTPSLRPPQPPAQQPGHRSLYAMSLRVILRNLSSVQDLGVLPYRHAKPILEECRISQLIQLEEASPHLLAHTGEIWRRNCLRDFLELRRKYTGDTPAKEPKSWRKLYLRTRGEIEQAKTDAARRIKDKYEQHRAEKEAKKLVVRDRPLLSKAARAGGRKFGAVAGAAGVSKGQSLLNKARSGSAAQAKLTANPRAGTPFRTQGRSRAVGAEIAPEAAGVEVRQTVRPMVAPRRVLGGPSEGLARMKEFTRQREGEPAASVQPSNRRSVAQRADGGGAATAAAGTESIAAVPRIKPREVAAAPALTSPRDRLKPTTSSPSTDSTRRPASPPPDIARTERRKLDFFGGSAARSSPSNAVASSSNSSPRGGLSPLSPGSAVQVRGMKRAHSQSVTAEAVERKGGSGSSGSKGLGSPPAAGSGVPFFASRAAAAGGGNGGVRVVHAKRARVQERSMEAGSSSPPPPPPAAAAAEPPTSSNRRQDTGPPVRRPSSSSSTSRPPPAKQADTRLARASPAALSSIFMPASSSGAATYRNGTGRNGSSRS